MRTVTGSWIRFACFSVILSASLAACGGGSSGTTASEQSSGQPPAAPAPAPTPNPTPAPTPAPAPANAAPTISGTATPTAVTGQAWSFQPSAADANQDTVTFTIANKPAWAAFNATTGLLSGTPAAANVGTYSGIEIAATDGNSVAALPAFAITVTAAPAATAVSLAWTPPTQNDDGSTLTDLSGYKIHYGTTSKSYSQSIPLTNAAGLTRYELDSLPKGTIYIAMTAVNASGSESDFSTEVAVTLN